jgi:hypothetical protein
MRELADAARIERFMRELSRATRAESHVYFTGGATAVLHGWRESTIDVAIKLIPDRDEFLRELPRLKEELNVNVGLAAPSDFITLPRVGRNEVPPSVRKGHLSKEPFPRRAALGPLEGGAEAGGAVAEAGV